MILLKRSKEQLHKRWMREYLHALEERQHRSGKDTVDVPKVWAVVHRLNWQILLDICNEFCRHRWDH